MFQQKLGKSNPTSTNFTSKWLLIGASLSEPHINGVSSQNHCIPMVRRTYIRHSNCKRYVRNSNCKRYGM